MLRVSRRHVLAGSAAALVPALQRTPGVGARMASAGPPAAQLVEDLVAANRILADQGVLGGTIATPRASSCRARWRPSW